MKKLNRYNFIFKHYLYYKIINIFSKNGCKSTSEKNFKLFLKSYYKTSKKKACILLMHCLKNNSIVLNIKAQKKGSIVFKEIPFFVKNRIRTFYAIKSLKKQTNEFEKMPIQEKIVSVISSGLKKTSADTTVKLSLTKLALKKKSQAHYRWFY